MTRPRVRFAPSPTGPLHIGGLRTALYNYLFAKKHGGDFILRIEDTGQKRFVAGAEDYIVESLKWSGFTPDEGVDFGGDFGPYRQSERTAHYLEYTQKLLADGKAYYAFDSADSLDALRKAAEATGNVFRYDASTRMKLNNSLTISKEELNKRIESGEDYVVRLLVNADDSVIFEDRIRGTVRMSTNELDDKVLLKADGLPTYHLANVVDDHLMKITHVIRGEEWLPSTAHHVLLYQALGFEETMPEFAHLPLILKPEGKGKLSKRDGAKFGFPVFPLEWKEPKADDIYTGFREEGFMPEAVVNFLAFLGWNPGTDQEIFSLAELVEAFKLDKISKGGARFDFAKAKWFNQQYIAALDPETFTSKVEPIVKQAGYDVCNDYLLALAPLMRERLTSLEDLPTEGKYFFEGPTAYDDKQALKRIKKTDESLFDPCIAVMEACQSWKAEDISTCLKTWASEVDLKLGLILPLYRIALTGGMSGPDVFEMSEVLGKQEVISRMSQAFAHFKVLKAQQTTV